MELIEKYPLDFFLKNKFIFTESASKKKLVFPTVHNTEIILNYNCKVDFF